MKVQTINFDRKLNEKHLIHFKENGLLNFLVSKPLIPEQTLFPELVEFDIQFREYNNVAIYCGLTKILNIKFYNNVNETFKFNSQSYSKQKFFPKIDDYSDAKEILGKIDDYFKNLTVNRNWWNKEGKVQTQYYSICGTNWNKCLPVAIFDKEIVFSYPSDLIKRKYNSYYREQVNLIKQKLTGNEKWAKFKISLPDEIDLMGISSSGDSLFLIEVKADNAGSSELYFSPFQLLSYLLKLNDALKENPGIISNINDLIRQKKEIGLLPIDFPELKKVNKIIPVLAVNKKIWSTEVQNRLASVLKAINHNLNNYLSGFEIWEVEKGGIKRTFL